MPIFPPIETGVFEPEVTAAMGEAFEAACKELYGTGLSEGVREFIAARIIGAASLGERDPVRIRLAALRGFTACCDQTGGFASSLSVLMSGLCF